MKSENIKYQIAKLIYKSITKTLTDDDEIILNDWLAQKNNRSLYNKIINRENIQKKIAIYNAIDVDKIYERLIVQIQDNRKTKVVFRYRKLWVKYVAASVLIIGFASLYFHNKGLFNTINEDLTVPIIVNDQIQPGTDKATLTFDDGSQIILENGNTIKTKNANSDGKAIVYEGGNKKVKELVYHYLTIPRGGQFQVVLSDGTKVWLNSESQLKYPVNFIDGEIREVELVYGEAYFEVSPSTKNKGAKFKVINSAQDVEVLGTEFNIKAYKDEGNIYTTLVQGKVSVHTNNSRKVLKPSEQSNLNLISGGITISEVNAYNEILWKDGIFSFEHKPLEEILKILSRWYDIDFVLENKRLADITFTGILSKDQRIEKILANIKTLSIIEDYEILEKTIKLK
ncbi:FecR domain-containing protein [Gaetbulibacter sp. M240]|uniref:FecR family protein n=1 Tax=Gaetbulibacter sp. M240 TaxID=3126511 RepID=UPI00374E22A9